MFENIVLVRASKEVSGNVWLYVRYEDFFYCVKGLSREVVDKLEQDISLFFKFLERVFSMIHKDTLIDIQWVLKFRDRLLGVSIFYCCYLPKQEFFTGKCYLIVMFFKRYLAFNKDYSRLVKWVDFMRRFWVFIPRKSKY